MITISNMTLTTTAAITIPIIAPIDNPGTPSTSSSPPSPSSPLPEPVELELVLLPGTVGDKSSNK